jgi:hypothetical protein
MTGKQRCVRIVRLILFIGSASGYPITPEFLKLMHDYVLVDVELVRFVSYDRRSGDCVQVADHTCHQILLQPAHSQIAANHRGSELFGTPSHLGSVVGKL